MLNTVYVRMQNVVSMRQMRMRNLCNGILKYLTNKIPTQLRFLLNYAINLMLL